MDFNRLLRKLKPLILNKNNQASQQKVNCEPERGLPPGIDWDTLSTLCKTYLSNEMGGVSYQHLSAWKVSGAYRLFIHLANGKDQQLIFKESRYNEDEIPGMIGLPVNLAIPEFIIYQQNLEQPLLFLPKVFLAEEIEVGKKYRFVFEDLSQEYKRIDQGQAILNVMTQFADIYNEFINWSHQVNLTGLIHYDKNYSHLLQKYAYENISQLDPSVVDPIYYQVLNHWSDICSIHMMEEFYENSQNHLIHGDLNYSNIHLHQRDPKLIKIVDWEWAGFGSPLSDFVSLTKGSPPNLKTAAYKKLVDISLADSPFNNIFQDRIRLRRTINWCHIERGMLDAGFLSAQYSKSSHQARYNLPKAINRALDRLFDAYLQLSN
jgi:hypothetical protein